MSILMFDPQSIYFLRGHGMGASQMPELLTYSYELDNDKNTYIYPGIVMGIL